MGTRLQRNRRAKKSKYLLFAILGLLSLIAYTMQQKAPNTSNFEQSSLPNQVKSKTYHQDLMAPFTQSWQQVQADIEHYLMDEDDQKTRYFFDGYNVASNDEIVLPTEETGAGNPKENYIQDLNDVIVADMVPTGYSTGGSGAGVGGVGGIGGGGAGGSRDNKRTQYVAKEDIEDASNRDKTDEQTLKGDNGVGTSNGGISAVPAPPAIWLLGSALIAFVGLRRK